MNLAGCGPSYNQGGWPVPPGYDQAWTPFSAFQNLPQTAPALGVGQQVGPNQVIEQHLTPCGVIVEAGAAGAPVTVSVAPDGGALMYGSGISSCNDCFQIVVESITTGSLPYDLVGCSPCDAAIWNTDQCFCPMEIGCFWSVSPLTTTFSAFGEPSVPPYLNMTIFATKQSGVFDCGLSPVNAFIGGAQRYFGGGGSVAPGNGNGGGGGSAIG